MSRADVDRAWALFASLEKDGVEGAVEYFHPEFEGVVPPDLSAEPDTYRGHAGVRRYFALWEQDIDEFQVTAEDAVDAGDAVVIAVRIRGRGRGSGVEVELPAAVRFTTRDGLIHTMKPYPTVDDALAGG